jgi:hypothetical protein
MALYASYFGLVILRRWDLRSGSELQLSLERRTYLISSLVKGAFAFEALSLFLFIYTAEGICTQLVGAMCAAGSLNAHPLGYPALLVKLLAALMAGVWLVINRVDERAEDYPLIRAKYGLLLAMAPLALVEAAFTWGYLLGLKPDVITSCCGSLFSRGGEGLGGGLASFPPRHAMWAYYTVLAATLVVGLRLYRTGRGGYAFAALSLALFVVSVAALISGFSPYIYELPTHGCPFCLLKREYGYIGYPMYASLFTATVAGLGTGALRPFRRVPSLGEVLPGAGRRLTLLALVMFSAFAALATYGVVASGLEY